MSKMKHLLRKLHIGGAGINDHHSRIPESRAASDPSPSREGRAVESGDRAGENVTRGGVDFNLMEEEFQVQLALAISASDPDAREDPEIDAAKRISLGCCSSLVAAPVSDALVESLSLRYWSYNVLNYNEKVIDGFYDVYGISSNSVLQGKMPLLVDLQAITVSDTVNYEVILVNRLIDPDLRELERKAYIMSNGLALNDLIQKIADIVVDRMGGPVDCADEISRRWTRRSYELRSALNTVTLPLGCLDVGLSRHRALLFKVLADKINLPCMLVKGSYYTGTDDGAVNLIKIGNESEYIIDLMGAPGTLIPAEVPSSLLPSAGFDGSNYFSSVEPAKGSSLEHVTVPETLALSPYVHRVPEVVDTKTEEQLSTGVKTNEQDMNLVEKDQTDQFERDFRKLFPSSHTFNESSSSTMKSSSAEKIKVKNVSKYVISAAKNPQFAQKLHAVLLESGASPPPDLFSDINSQDLAALKVSEQVHLTNDRILDDGLHFNSNKLFAGQSVPCLSRETTSNRTSDVEHKQSPFRPEEEQRDFETYILKSEGSSILATTGEGFMINDNKSNEKYQMESANAGGVPDNLPGMLGRTMYENQNQEVLFPSTIYSCQLQQDHAIERGSNMETDPGSSVRSNETSINDMRIDFSGYNEQINPVLGEVAEWEIPWEDLQIGERIGIGSYGEVYHADWNGTEVAVKKFLDQDFSGDALVQFRYEAELMLRLRHPNVVLFMGAVTRPPHLSILTEFLPRGSLYRLLHRPNPLDEKRRMRMALDVAKGMNYLHTSHPTIVHRDLKTPNLLVDKNWVVKVCDFGLSRTKHHTFLSSKSTAGTPEWMAPEVLRNELANEKCDVFSFGVILWELATCDVPWKGMNPMQVVGAVGFQNRRLAIPPETNPAIAQIIEDCWQTEPHLRPSFSQIISRLRRVNRLLIERTHHTNQTTEQ